MSKRLGKSGYRYITEVTTPGCGYVVSIPHPTDKGKYVRKTFLSPMLLHEDRLADAIAWRTEIYLALYGIELPPSRAFHHKQANSNTSIPGVSRVEKQVAKRRKDGSEIRYTVPCFIAQICTVPGDGYARSVGFRSKLYSIKKYGEDEAFRRACQWREEMVNLLECPI